MKVDSVTGRSFKAGDERAARHPGTECATVPWRWSEFLTSLRKLSKADRRLSFPEMDTLPQVTFEIARRQRSRSADKARRKQYERESV